MLEIKELDKSSGKIMNWYFLMIQMGIIRLKSIIGI